MSTLCSACGDYKSRQHFSKTQLKKFPTRRCRDCVNNDREITEPPLSKIASYIQHHCKCHKNCHHGRPETISIAKLNNLNAKVRDSFSWQIKVLCVMKQMEFSQVYCAFIDKYGDQVSVTIDFSVLDPSKIVKGSVYLISNAGIIMDRFEESTLHLALVRHSKIVQLPNYAFHQIKARKPPQYWDKMEELMGMRFKQMFDKELQKAMKKVAWEDSKIEEELVHKETIFVHNHIIGIIARIDRLITTEDGYDYRKIRISDRTGEVVMTLWHEDACNPMWQKLYSSDVDYNTENKENMLIGEFRDVALDDGIFHVFGTFEIFLFESYKQCAAKMRMKYGFGSKRLLAPMEICQYCGESGTNMKLCRKCRKVHYCGKRCQKKSWKKDHRDQCL